MTAYMVGALAIAYARRALREHVAFCFCCQPVALVFIQRVCFGTDALKTFSSASDDTTSQ